MFSLYSVKKFFYNISKWITSEILAIPLALILYTSPLSPLSTLNLLRQKGFFEYIPTIEAIRSNKLNFYSGRFRNLIKLARFSHTYGEKGIIRQEIERQLQKVEVELELADYNLTQFYEFMSIFTTIFPSIIASTLIFIDISLAVSIMILLALASNVASFLSLVIFPLEARINNPNTRSLARIFILFGILSTIFYIISSAILNLYLPATLSLGIAAFLPSIVMFNYIQEEIKELDEAMNRIRLAISTPFNIFKHLGKMPKEIILETRNPIAKAANICIYLISLYSGKKDAYMFLESYYRRYLDFIKRLRDKTRVMLIYFLIECTVIASIHAFMFTALEFMSKFDVLSSGIIKIPTHVEIMAYRKSIDLILTLTSLALSLTTANSREGNPVFFLLYLPFSSVAITVAFYVAYFLGGTLFL